jgi:hypothetical protein
LRLVTKKVESFKWNRLECPFLSRTFKRHVIFEKVARDPFVSRVVPPEKIERVAPQLQAWNPGEQHRSPILVKSHGTKIVTEDAKAGSFEQCSHRRLPCSGRTSESGGTATWEPNSVCVDGKVTALME